MSASNDSSTIGYGFSRCLVLLLLFNALVFQGALFSIFCAGATESLSDVLVGDWKLAQFLSAYQLEFMKRGLVATGFSLFDVEVSYRSIVVFNTVVINLFFLVFYQYARHLFRGREIYFVPFMLVFIFAPGTALQMGADFARFDQLNVLITLIAMMVLLDNTPRSARGDLARVLWVAATLVLGLLIHEAYLFIFAPLLLALSYQRAMAGQLPRYALWLQAAAVLVAMVVIIKYGFAAPPVLDTMAASMAQLTPDYDSALTLRVWDRRLVDSLSYTISLYFQYKYLKQILVLSLPVMAYGFWLYRLCYVPSMPRNHLWILLSPLAIAPMYIIGCDFPRWTGLLVLMAFMVFLIMLHDSKVRLPPEKYLGWQYLLPVLAIGLLVGPVGVSEAFPERWAILHNIKCLLASLVG